MAISDDNTVVQFVTTKDNLSELKAVVNAVKKDGRKMTVSSLCNDIVSEYLESRKLFLPKP